MKFRKKPVVIEAIQFNSNENDIIEFCSNSKTPAAIYNKGFGERLAIVTLEGDMTVSQGDWVIKGVSNECYPCKPDIFDITYEAVDES